MATRSQPESDTLHHDVVPAHGELVEYEEFIESQLRKTRSQVRGVDIAAGLMLLVGGSLAYFFACAILDHWVLPGGLGFWGRLLLLAIYLSAAVWWIATQIVPLAIKRINPLYAAYTIERSRPTLKNSLVNFLMFRANPAGLHQKVFEAIEEQAATNLVGVEVESTVDRSRLVRLGYVLIGVLLVCAMYALVSPKNPFQTIGRVAFPWADIAPPTRTTIDEITPGDSQAFRGQQASVQARVQGLPDGAKVTLYYTTADRQIVDRAVEMNRPANDYRHAAVLPSSESALQQTLEYRIEAGDAVTRTHTIEVVAAPTMVVQALEYRYPEYTGLVTQRVEHQGDIKAIEGTEIALEAIANQDITSAHVDFGCDRKLDLRMTPDKQTARAKFRLFLNADRRAPEHDSYQLLFQNGGGQGNPQPVRHQIEVTRDLSPEVQFAAPKRDEVDVPLDGYVDLEVVANDPDFSLASVKLLASRGADKVLDEPLLKEVWRGQFGAKYRFDPRKLKLAAGDVVEYHAVAVDNKKPRPNQAETPRRRIRVISASGENDTEQPAQNERANEVKRPASKASERPRDEQPRDGKAEPKADSKPEKPSGEQPPENAGQQKDKQTAKRDPARRDDAQDDRSKKNEQKGSQGQQPEGGGSEEQGAQENAAQEEQQDQGQSSEKKSGEKKSGEKQAGQQQAGEGQSNDSGKGDDSAKRDEQQSVASDGTNDGDAIERILKHRQDQEPQSKEKDRPAEQQPEQQRDSSDASSQSKKSAQGQQQQPNDKSSQDKPSQEKQPSQKQGPQDGKQQQQGKQETGKSDDQKQSQAGEKGDDQKAAGQDQKPGSDSQQDQPGKEPSEKQQGKQPSNQQKSGGQQSEQAKQKQGDQGGDGQQDKGQQKGEQQQKDQQGKNQQGQSEAGESGKESSKQDGQQQGQSGKQSEGQSDSGQEQSGDKSPSTQQGQPGKQQPSGDPQSSDEQGQGQTKQQSGKSGKNQDKSKVDERERGEGSDSQNGKQPGEQRPGEKPSEKQDQRSGATQDNNTRQDGTPQDPMTKGQGAQSKDDPTRNGQQKPKQDQQQQPDAQGGDGEQAKGESGAGEQSNENKGSPRPQESNTPTKKSQQPGDQQGEQRPDGKEQSPSTSKNESDSQGSEDGDRSGGGKKGGGQKANKPGTGGAGQNTAADEGAGKSEQSGDGETSDRKGDDRQANGKTGQSGSQQGSGSESRPADGKNDQPGGDSAGEAAQDGSQSTSGSSQGSATGGENAAPKGTASDSPPQPQQWKAGSDAADKANLDYSRKATDLAIEHLKNQMKDGKADPELLDRLGWTPKDAENFVRRWEAMRNSAQAPGEQGAGARRQLDQTLRSLGLRPRATTKQSSASDDRSQGYRESSRTTPPAEYSEAFKAYTQGTARGGK